jgi:hypothetical protein
MRKLQITLLKFNELTDDAKEVARSWFRQNVLDNMEWWDCTIDMFKTTVCPTLGIDVNDVFFSLAHCQGDGACFTGSYEYKVGSVKAIKEAFPVDIPLHNIAEELQEAQRAYFYQLKATIKSNRSRYSHENAVDIEVYDYRTGEELCDPEDNFRYSPIDEPLRDLMRWLYKWLDTECTYLNSDEAVDEGIQANDYEFHPSGSFPRFEFSN